MSDQLKQAPLSATCLADGNGVVAFSEKDGKSSFHMIVNSGKPFSHWYWGKLALDMEGVKFNGSKFPVLAEHDIERRIGFSKKPKVTDKGLEIDDSNFSFVNSADAEKFQSESKDGFPFQASVRARVKRVEEIEEGASVEVNGYKLSGPAAVWREWQYMEGSVCVFGADPNTKSQAFTDTDEKVEYLSFNSKNEEKESNEMKGDKTLADLQKEYPDAFKEYKDSIEAPLVAEVTKLSEENQGLKTKVEAMKEESKGMKDEIAELSNRIAQSDKRTIKLEEKNKKDEADRIWEEKFNDADIPVRMHKKIMAMPSVKLAKFENEQGEVDWEAFEKAVDEELKDWTSFARPDTSHDRSFGRKANGADEEFSSDKITATVDSLTGLAPSYFKKTEQRAN